MSDSTFNKMLSRDTEFSKILLKKGKFSLFFEESKFTTYC